MRVYVSTHGPLARGARAGAHDVPSGATVRDLAARLSIPEDEVNLVMAEGAAAGWDTVLFEGARVAFYAHHGD